MTIFLMLVALQAAPNDTIIVIGRKPEEARAEAQEFVRRTGIADEPVARWLEPVCPQVIGVAPGIAARVVNRVRAAATAAGARVAKTRCEGNLMISFVRNGEAVVRDVAKRSPDMLKDVDRAHRAILYSATSPIRWWHVVQARTKDGQRDIGNDVPPSAGIMAGSGAVQLGGQVFTQYRSSVAGTQMVRALRAATVIVDVDYAEGAPLDSVADFATLVGLAEIRPSDPPPPGSILNLFDDAGPRNLTALDTRFLETLYKLPLDRTALAHRGLIVRGLVEGQKRKADR